MTTSSHWLMPENRYPLAVQEATTPAEWLLRWYESAPRGCRTGIHRLLTFKSVIDAGTPMRVVQADYADPERWWL